MATQGNFHISKNGKSRKCSAPTPDKCRAIKSDMKEHFPTREAAEKRYEEIMSSKGKSISSHKKPAVKELDENANDVSYFYDGWRDAVERSLEYMDLPKDKFDQEEFDTLEESASTWYEEYLDAVDAFEERNG